MPSDNKPLLYLCQCWLIYMSPYGITRLQWANSVMYTYECLYTSLSKLLQVMVCRLLNNKPLPIRTHFIEFVIEIETFSFNKMHLKVSSARCWWLYSGIIVLITLFPKWLSTKACRVRSLYTVKPVYNDHLMGYFSAFWSSSRSRRQTLLARVNWYLQFSLKRIPE